MNRGKKITKPANPRKYIGRGQSSSSQPQTNRQSQYGYPQQPSAPGNLQKLEKKIIHMRLSLILIKKIFVPKSIK